MLSELERLLPSTAVCASIANRMSFGHVVGQPWVLLRHYPPESAVQIAVMRYFHRYDFGSVVDRLLQTHQSGLTAAKSLNLAHVIDLSGATRDEVDLLRLRSTWQSVCSNAIELIEQAVKQLRHSDEPPLAALIELLGRAAEGKSPCVGNDGNIILVPRSDRRHRSRLQVNVPVTIWHWGDPAERYFAIYLQVA